MLKYYIRKPSMLKYLNLRSSNTIVDTYAHLIPVIIISMLVLYENNLAYIANSPLGKIIAILLIVYYTSVKFTYGLLACSLIVLYYQYDYVRENQSSKNEDSSHIFRSFTEENARENGMNTSFEINENFTTIQSFEKANQANSSEDSYPENLSVSQFKSQYCKNGTLVNKGSTVNLEMLEHIHPGIHFKNEKCNPCADTCDFSIIEEQLNAEENLKPKTSDDFSIKTVLEKINDFIPALWVKSEPFAALENTDNEKPLPKK
jgi:hypothetical protein